MTVKFSDDVIRGVIHQVLTELRGPGALIPNMAQAGSATGDGVFSTIDQAANAASVAQKEFNRRGIEDRALAIARLTALLEQGALKHTIGPRFALDQMVQAHQGNRSRQPHYGAQARSGIARSA
jgi:NADPH:quinone reductase-like Zn-dependent oxidoreductase